MQSKSGFPKLIVTWVGSLGGMEKALIQRAGVSYQEIPGAGVHGVGWFALPGNLVQLVRGYWRARQVLRDFQPDVLFFTGGYVAVPMAVAGRHIPSVLFVPDVEPGLALKQLARYAKCIAISVEDTRQFFKPSLANNIKVIDTGYPTRPDLQIWEPEAARQALQLRADLPVLLVFGGSKGARSINNALFAALPELLQEMQVIHITGQLDWPAVETIRSRLDEHQIERYHAYPYLHDEMGAALRLADLVVARAGASTLGEFPLFGLPAILVPYPYAWQYQKVNAQYLADRQAAIVITDEDLPAQLLPTVRKLMQDTEKRAALQQAMRSLARPTAANTIASLLLQLAMSDPRRKRSPERRSATQERT